MKIRGSLSSIELSLTNFCRLKCLGCPSLDSNSKRKIELDYKRVKKVINDIDFHKIVLCGNDGEPLEHSQIKSVLKDLSITFPDITIHVSTNGEKITEIFSPGELKSEFSNIHFEVAIDGPDEVTHQLTRKEGDFPQVLASLGFLKTEAAKFSVIYSRHAGNETLVEKTYLMLKEKFDISLEFRDTTIVNSLIGPPTILGQHSNVGMLYNDYVIDGQAFTPNLMNLYVDSNGDCYPCVSFTKYKTQHPAVNIYNYESPIEFLKDFTEFKSKFCSSYRKEGDLRQCQLNCGVYMQNYQYENFDDLRSLND